MERLIKELVQIEKKKLSLLAEISKSLNEIANRETLVDTTEAVEQNGYYDCPL